MMLPLPTKRDAALCAFELLMTILFLLLSGKLSVFEAFVATQPAVPIISVRAEIIKNVFFIIVDLIAIVIVVNCNVV